MKKLLLLIITIIVLFPLNADAKVVDSKSSTVSVTFVDSGETSVNNTQINDTTENLTVSNNDNVKIFAESVIPTELSIANPDDMTIEKSDDGKFVIKRHAATIIINDIASQITDASSIDITNENQTPVHYTIVNGP